MKVGELREILSSISSDSDVCIECNGSLWRLGEIKIKTKYCSLGVDIDKTTVVSLHSSSEILVTF